VTPHDLKRPLMRLAALAASALALAAGASIEANAQANAPAQIDPALAAKGEYLARAGDCIACHTPPEGKLFAGGRPMLTPFGTLYTSNITPDPETGIGRWTVEMFLIFRLGRPDVLPVSDYGVRKGFALTFGKLKPSDKVTPADLPTPAVMEKRAEKWRPWRSIASWYLWRACDLAAGKLLQPE